MAGLVKKNKQNTSHTHFFLQVTKRKITEVTEHEVQRLNIQTVSTLYLMARPGFDMQHISKTRRQEFVGSFVISPFLSKGLGSEVTNSTVRSILA